MKTMPPDVLRFVQEKAPHVVEAIRKTKQEKRDQAGLALRLATFEDDPFLLYAALWYAYGEGVEVTFQAPKRPARR